MFTRNGSRGFTLVELAIVLVIVGLLLGGVLQGQKMIENAKYKKLQNMIQGLQAAYYTYLDTYGQVPGDDPYASQRCSGLTANHNGNGNGVVDWPRESGLVYLHLSCTGILKGSSATSSIDYTVRDNVMRVSLKSPVGGWISIHRAFGNINGVNDMLINRLMIIDIPPDAARKYDQMFDDGKCNSGTVTARYTNCCNTSTGIYTCSDEMEIFVGEL